MTDIPTDTVTPIDLSHPPTDAGLRALLGIVPDIQSAIGRIDSLERQVRTWVSEEVAAVVARIEAAHAPAATPTPPTTDVPVLA